MANVVSDTGPLIALAAIDHFGLLRSLFHTIHIPPAVRAEILDARSEQVLGESNWIVIQAVQDRLATQLLLGELDRGESEAIILARESNADLVLIDERAATRKARALGLNTIGTLGILLMAKDQGFLSAIKPALEKLQETGFRMTEALYRQILNSTDELDG